MSIEDEIVSKIVRGRAVLFVGAGLSVGAGLPSWKEFASELAAEIGCSTTLSPPDIAQYYENEKGRHALYTKLRTKLKEKAVSYNDNHRKLVSLGFRTIITTNYDRLLEDALRACGYEFHSVINEADASYWDEEKEIQLLKLHGDIENADSIVLTRKDYNSFFRTHVIITHRLHAILLDHPLVFVGYKLEDPDCNFVFSEITLDLQEHRLPSYFIGFNVDRFRQKELERVEVKVFNVTTDIVEPNAGYQEAYNVALEEKLDDLSSKTEARRDERVKPLAKESQEFSLVNEIRDLLQAMGYKVSRLAGTASRQQLLAEKKSEGKNIKRFILCSSSDVGSGDVDAMLAKISTDADADAWLVAPSKARISQQSRALAEKSGRVQVLSLADFYAQMVPFTDYLESLVQQYESSDIPRYYVELGARKPQFDATRSKVIREDSFRPIDEYIDSWLQSSDQNHISTLGDYGTGKTWFCIRYAAKQAKRYLADPEHHRIPILISLKEFTKTLKIEPLITDALVNAYGLQLGGGFSTFQHLNQYGKLLVIFDGFDEMESRVDQMVTTRNFEELAKAVVPGGNSKVILTCRTPYFQSNLQEVTVLMGEGEDRIDLRSRPNFEIMYLEPFDDEQVKEALRKRVPDSWQYYYQEIQATYDLPNLSKRPVMIEMIVDTLPDVKDLPEINSAVLYRKYTERWIKKNIQEERTFLDAESKQIFMEELAWEMYRSGISSIHFTDIPAKVQHHFGLSSKTTVDYYEHDIRAQSYLVRDHQGNYSFAHKSFLEFFVASRILRSIGENDESLLADRGLTLEIYDFLIHMLGQSEILTVNRWLETSHESKVRRTCVVILGRLKDSSACDVLGKVLSEDPQPSIRRRATGALWYIGVEKAKTIIVEALKHERDGKVIRTMLGKLPQEDASLEPIVEEIARNRNIEDNVRRLAIRRIAKLGQQGKATSLAMEYFGEDINRHRGKEHSILEVIDAEAAAEIAEKIVNSARAPEHKLWVIRYLPSKLDATLTSNVAGVLRHFYDSLKYAQSKANYPAKKVRIGKQLVAKCLEISELPEILELCHRIEAAIAELDERFSSGMGGTKPD
jgi:hypothetical protein